MNQTIKDFLKEIEYDESIIDKDQLKRVDEWLKWYKGKTKYHNYYVYNGKKKIKQTLKSLNIASQSCEDISDFYFNEKLDIKIDNKNASEKILEILRTNDFLFNGNKLLQLVKALGTGAIIPYLDKGVLKINYIDATGIIILEADKTGVKSVLFWSITGSELRINAHLLTEKGYVIHNRKYKKDKNGDYIEQQIDEGMRIRETGSFIPEFAMLFTPEVNNFDISSPYGISCFANATDTILSIDSAYDSLDNEITGGRKRVYVKGGAVQFNTDENGEITPVFDPTDTVYYQVPGQEKDPLITESQGDLRITPITDSLQAQLNLYTSKVGLGHEYYRFKDGKAYVNTNNIISANSDTYRKIKKQENIITSAIRDLCYGIAKLIGMSEEFNVSVDYDDSIIEDTESVQRQALTEYNAKLISKAEYFRYVYKYDDKNALDFVRKMEEEIKEEQKALSNGEEPGYIE